MKTIDVRAVAPLTAKHDVKIVFGNASEYLIAEREDTYFMLNDEDGDRVRIYNTDIDTLIRALQAMKEYL